MPNDHDENALNKTKLDKMKYEILALEQRNLNTGEKANETMVDLIKQTIVSIADQTY